jgi:hypothetical protein
VVITDQTEIANVACVFLSKLYVACALSENKVTTQRSAKQENKPKPNTATNSDREHCTIGKSLRTIYANRLELGLGLSSGLRRANRFQRDPERGRRTS